MTTGITDAGGSAVLERQVRIMLQAALLIFVYTIVVGILNGLDLVEFERRLLLAHLHGGTLGWLTLGILAAAIYLFTRDAPVSAQAERAGVALSYLAIGAITMYVVAFATTFGVFRPIAGVTTLTALVGFAVWTFARARRVTLAVPHLLILVGLTTSVLGGTFGVINGLAIALDWDWVPDGFFEAHPGTMEVGFVLPVAMGLAEWGLRRDRIGEPASRAGLVQVVVMFVAFLIVLTAALTENTVLIGPGTGLATLGLVIFFVRMWRAAVRTSLLRRAPERHAVMGGLLLGVGIAYITVAINMAGGDFEAMPRGQALSFLHMLAVGGTTNALLSFVVYLSRATTAPHWIDDVIFAGVNIGVIGFVVALTAGSTALVMTFVPLMGGALLLAIAVHVMALRGSGAAGAR